MNAKRSGLVMFTFVVIAMTVGCGALPFFNPRLSDGGGGDLISGGLKVVQGSMASLTQDEIQQLSDQINAAIRASNPEVNPPELTNEQADAFIAFLKANSVPGGTTTGLNSIEDITNFVAAAADDPSIIVLPPGFEEAFGDQDFGAIFDSVVGDA